MTDWGPFSLRGKRAIITGGAMGIGLGIAKRMAEAGADVLIADKALKEAQAAVAEMEHSLGQAEQKVAAVEVDLLSDAAPKEMIAAAMEKLGGLDILVNNAGIYPSTPMMDTTPELFDRVYRINLRALVFTCQQAAEQMVKQGSGGKIVNIASIDSVHPSSVGLAAYDASKGGVLMFTKNFALEMAPYGIRVNAIAPGGIITAGTSNLSADGAADEQMKAMLETFARQIPLGRMGNPDDIGKVAVFLASPAADYMTGSLVVVDGGRLLA